MSKDKTSEKDITEKSLFAYNDVFCDIINGCLFDGNQVIKPDELADIMPDTVFRNDSGELHEQERDILKRWSKHNVDFALIGIENQTVPDRLMPARVISYDGASYKSQLLNDVYPLAPVVTIVLNLGENKWPYPSNLKSILSICPEIEKYVNDYNIHIVNVTDLTGDELEKFTSDFKIVAGYLHDAKRHEKNIRLNGQFIKHVDGVLKVLSAISDYDTIACLAENSKNMGECNMFDLFKDAKEEGFHEGELSVLQMEGLPE